MDAIPHYNNLESPRSRAAYDWSQGDPGPTKKLRHADGPHQLRSIFGDPQVDDVIDNCLLIADLGSGGSGHVFLARQIELANRPLVVKITTATHDEHLNLARLQHTHIMPIYWASKLNDLGLRVIAMPYLAKTTLATLLKRLEPLPRSMWTGNLILEELQADQDGLPHRIPAQEHLAQALKHATWVEFVARMGKTLAEALAYAHERDLLHLDIKPGNIVITPDGQPILLDLDVARSPIAAGATTVPWLGGTPAYVSPEQELGMDALTNRRPVPRAIDGRSDLYSLALVLFQALGGMRDVNGRPDIAKLLTSNSHVSRDFADILAHALAEHPSQRYASCQAFADDLDCYLRDLPLQGVRDRLSQRWRKWRKRRPMSLPMFALALSFALAAGTAGFGLFHANEERHRQAEASLLEGQEWQRKGQHEAAVRSFLKAKEFADQSFGGRHLHAQLARRLHGAQRLQKADELAKVVHLLRFYALQEHTPRRMQHVLEAGGRTVWAERELLTDTRAGELENSVELQIRSHLQEFVHLWTNLQIRLAPETHVVPVRDEVKLILTDAERLFGPSLGLSLAKEQHGMPGEGRMAPQAAWEFCALARLELANGKLDAAERQARRAVELEPLGYSTNFYLGVILLRQSKHHEASRALSFCLGIDACAECYVLRAEALMALNEQRQAMHDFDAAIERNPSLAFAYEQRGRLHEQMGHGAAARADIARARTLRD